MLGKRDWSQFPKVQEIDAVYRILVTPRSRFLLEKLTVAQFVKKSQEFYETRRFIISFTQPSYYTEPVVTHKYSNPILDSF